MKKIFKYKVEWFGDLTEMPEGAEIVSFAQQGDDIYVWAIIDTEAPMGYKWFRIVGTGHELPKLESKYLATVHMTDGFVWHIFETGGKNG